MKGKKLKKEEETKPRGREVMPLEGCGLVWPKPHTLQISAPGIHTEQELEK